MHADTCGIRSGRQLVSLCSGVGSKLVVTTDEWSMEWIVRCTQIYPHSYTNIGARCHSVGPRSCHCHPSDRQIPAIAVCRVLKCRHTRRYWGHYSQQTNGTWPVNLLFRKSMWPVRIEPDEGQDRNLIPGTRYEPFQQGEGGMATIATNATGLFATCSTSRYLGKKRADNQSLCTEVSTLWS